ncbi:MAG TPA: M48 family metallopeptidase [Gemmatimonadaceae bacterium]|nr:M48 family metallopeptidase [Gemmatimonadaceae bacterium]
MHRLIAAPALLLAGAITIAPLSTPIDAQATVRRTPSGFNLFSTQQDVEIGRQAAAEAEQQLPILNDRATTRYLNQIIQRLAAVAPGADYPYSIKAVNATEINAFALPGGPMYVNRGLISAARNESELVGVLAHEMAHVALRHGTTQASKAYLAQSGLGILGGLLGSRSSTAKIVNAVGGFGLNAAFLKFSRDYEYQADATGAQIMADAGYNPVAMADFFALLREQQGRDPSKLERFFSDHPPAADRENRIRQLAATLGPVQTHDVGGLATIQSRLGGVAVATSQTQWPTTTSTGTVARPANIRVSVPAPSSRFLKFDHPSGFFSIQYPSNWRTYATTTNLAVSMAPEGGVVENTDGTPVMVYGVIINHYSPFNGEYARRSNSLQRNYAPFEDRRENATRGSLEEATDDLIYQILATNTYLTAEAGSARAEEIDGARGYSVLLSGRSPTTGEDERVTAYTRELADGHVLYALCIAPSREWNALDPVCTRMLRTLIVDDNAAHRSTRVTRPR